MTPVITVLEIILFLFIFISAVFLGGFFLSFTVRSLIEHEFKHFFYGAFISSICLFVIILGLFFL